MGYDPLSVREMRGLVEDLREQVRYLRSILSEERDARKRADTIIAQLTLANAALTQRIPELEAPRQKEALQEPLEGPQSVGERRKSADAREGTERPWWRRMLGSRRGR
jgi:uncharacterized membrane protein